MLQWFVRFAEFTEFLFNLGKTQLAEIIADFDRQFGLKFDYNQEASLVRCTRPLLTSIQLTFGDDFK